MDLIFVLVAYMYMYMYMYMYVTLYTCTCIDSCALCDSVRYNIDYKLEKVNKRHG